jgi:hypothetical protein
VYFLAVEKPGKQAIHPQNQAVYRPHTPFTDFLLHGVFLLYILVA